MKVRSGFTLLEVLLVVAVIAMLVAIAIPSIQTLYADMDLQGGADHLRAQFALARTRAIEDGRPYRFAAKPDESAYRLAPDAPEFWDGRATPAPEEEDKNAPAPLIAEGALPNAIVFQFGDSAATPDAGGWTQLLTFNPDGSCSNDCTVRLELDGCRPIEISVRALTGAVSSRSLKAEASR